MAYLATGQHPENPTYRRRAGAILGPPRRSHLDCNLGTFTPCLRHSRKQPSPAAQRQVRSTIMASFMPESLSSGSSCDVDMIDTPSSSRALAKSRRLSKGTPALADSPQSSPIASSFSLLLSLPRELRDRVYRYALVLDRPVCWPHPPFFKGNIAHGLLTTSRQVYKETAPVLYSANKFLFSHPSDITMFRVVASSEYSEKITCAYVRTVP